MSKSGRNKTIDISLEEGREYLERCIYSDDVKEINEDSLVIGDTFKILNKIPKNSIDCIIVDPPYNLSKNFHGNVFNKIGYDEYADYTKKWLVPVIDLLKDDGSIFICCDWQTSLIIAPILQEKLLIQNRITWQREKGRGSSRNFKNCHEDIWFCTKTNKYKFYPDNIKHRRPVIAPYKDSLGKPKDWIECDNSYRDTYCSNFWDDITIPFWSMTENTQHPTQKSEKLIAKLICAVTDVGDTILDPFSGSGTTLVVAKKLLRKYIGIEINELYAIWSQIRLEKAKEDNRIQGYTDNVFLSKNFKAE